MADSGLIQHLCAQKVFKVYDMFNNTAQGKMINDKFGWGIPIGALIYLNIRDAELTILYVEDPKCKEFNEWKEIYEEVCCWFDTDHGYSNLKKIKTNINIDYNASLNMTKSANKL